MSRPTYRELEKRVQELEKSLSENTTETKLIEEKLNKSNKRFEMAVKGAGDGRPVHMAGSIQDIDKRKRSEELTGRQKEFLNRVIGSLPYPFFVINAENYTIAMANASAAPDDIPETTTCYSLTHKRSKPCGDVEHICPLEEVKRTKKSVVLEHLHYDRDGDLRNIEIHAHPLFDKNGNVVQLIEYTLDITERKRVQEALLKSERDKLAILNNMTEHVIYQDKEMRVRWANRAAVESVNLNPEDLVGGHCYEIWHQRSKPCEECPMNEVIQTGEAQEKEMIFPDGRVWIIHGYPLKNEYGELEGVVETTLEITERKQVEDELAKERNLLRTLIDHLRDLVYVKDAAGRFIVANEAVANYMGAAASEELIGRTDFEYYPKKTAEKFYADEQEILQSGRAIIRKEEVVKKNSGENNYFSTTKVPYRDSSGRNVGIVGLGRDITERKRMEEELRGKTHDLGKRVKELRCLYGISNLVEKSAISFEELLQGTAELIPGGWQYPAITCARIIIEDKVYVSSKFKEARWKQESKIIISGSKVGTLQVYYLEERPESDDGPFLKEERNLIDEIAERLGRIAERMQTNKRAKLAQTAVETALTAIITTDLEGIIIYANPAAARLWGFDCASDMIGTQVLDLLPKSLTLKVKKIMDHIYNKGEYIEMEGLPGIRKDGSVFTAAVSATLIKDISGKPSGIIASFMDITRRKLAEEEIKNLAKFSSENTSPVLRIRKDGTLLYSNRAGKALCDKWDCDVGRPVPDIWHRAISATIRVKKERIKEIKIKDLVFSLVIIPVPGTDYVNIYAHDITDQKLAEDQIRSSLKEKEVLLKEIHHRVKNNMQLVSSLISLQARFIKDEQILRILKDNQNRLKTMALIHEKLYKSKDMSRINFREYLKSLTTDLFRAYRADTHKIYLKMEVSDVFLEVEQAIPCGLIINELVSNALKHAFPGQRDGEIRVSCRSAGNGRMELTVGDDGIGIPEKLDLSRSSSLGLHMVKMLGEDQLQGKIEIDRSGGSEFRITF